MAIDGFHSQETSAIPAIPASTLYGGRVVFDNLVAEDKLVVKGAGVKKIDTEVPAGKKWVVTINLSVVETDA